MGLSLDSQLDGPGSIPALVGRTLGFSIPGPHLPVVSSEGLVRIQRLVFRMGRKTEVHRVQIGAHIKDP